MESDKFNNFFNNLFNWLPNSQTNQSSPSGDRPPLPAPLKKGESAIGDRKREVRGINFSLPYRENSGNFWRKIPATFDKNFDKNPQTNWNNERIFPDFKPHGYEVIEKLGHNYGGGRCTYLGANCKTKQPVVIKQFQFAKPGADWSAYKAHEREIKILSELSHPGIPRYLDSFETDEGFCLVHEYKNAKSLAVHRRLTPEKIKKIATSLLEIIVYLQNRVPPVIHRDIKPENILVDEYLKVYLVDFGLARIAGEDLMQSSVISGTPGFMPPEQLLDRDLTEASDLYGLGVTLICLLTQTKSTEINKIIDSHYRLQFQELVPFLSEALIEWLAKMVEPNASDRFPHAAAALEALTPISVDRTLPEVKLSQSHLEFTGEHGELLTQTIEITNSVADTTLEGRWEITTTPNPVSDGLSKSAQWLKIKPTKFKRNQVQCQIAIDTENLSIDQVYERNLLLHTNSETATQIVTVKVKVSAPKLTLAKTSAIIQAKLSSRLPLTLFLLGLATPITLVSPYIAGGIALPLAILICNDLSAKLADNDLNTIAEFSQKWLVAPGLTGIGIFLLTHLEIDWVESSTSQLFLRLLISLLMGGVGFGVFTLFKPAFKRIAVVLPLMIFASSFVFVGVTGGLLGKIAEAGVSTYILTGSVKQNLAREKLSKRLIFQKYALRAILGVGLGTAVTWLLVYFGIGSLIF